MKHFWTGTLLCAMLLFSVTANCSAKNVSAIKADSLYAAGQFADAALLYEFEAFRTGDYNLYAEWIYRKSLCLKQNKDFEKAAKCLKRINLTSVPDSVIYCIQYQTALNYYLNKEWSLAESELVMMPRVSGISSVNKEILYILVLNELRRWDEAREHLAVLTNERVFNDSVATCLKSSYETKIPKMKNKEKAEKLSTFLPGTGQIYAGYFWEGATNIAIQASLVGLTAYGFYLKYYLSSGLAGVSLLQKFYLGGVSRAGFLAEKTNYLRTRKYNDELKRVIVPYLTSAE